MLSLVIPTKNRKHVLNTLIKYFHDCNNENIEIIVEDNSDEINEFIKSYESSFIKYYHSSKSRTLLENFEIAVSRASGKFLCILGDDDGICLKSAIEVINILETNKLDYAISPRAAFYWPNLRRRFFGTYSFGFEAKYSYVKAKKLSPKKSLEKVLKIGGVQMLDLPKLYHGIVRKSVVDLLKGSTGAIFHSSPPDMSASIGLTIFAKEGYLHSSPFIISGISSGSGGGAGASGKHSSIVKEALFLSKSDKEKWPTEIPGIWTGGTVWSASMILTLKAINQDSLLNNFDDTKLHGYLIAFNPKLYFRYAKFSKKTIISIPYVLMNIYSRSVLFFKNIYVYLLLYLGKGKVAKSMAEYLSNFHNKTEKDV